MHVPYMYTPLVFESSVMWLWYCHVKVRTMRTLISSSITKSIRRQYVKERHSLNGWNSATCEYILQHTWSLCYDTSSLNVRQQRCFCGFIWTLQMSVITKQTYDNFEKAVRVGNFRAVMQRTDVFLSSTNYLHAWGYLFVSACTFVCLSEQHLKDHITVHVVYSHTVSGAHWFNACWSMSS